MYVLQTANQRLSDVCIQYIHIYVCIYRERERGREMSSTGKLATGAKMHVDEFGKQLLAAGIVWTLLDALWGVLGTTACALGAMYVPCAAVLETRICDRTGSCFDIGQVCGVRRAYAMLVLGAYSTNQWGSSLDPASSLARDN